MRHSYGFTLIELLLAGAIMASTAVVILALVISCSYLNDSSREFTVAVNHARLVLEEIKNSSYSSLSEAQSPPTGHASWGAWATAANGGGCNTLNSEQIYVAFTGTDPLDVLITVTYRGRRQIPNPAALPVSVSLRTRVTTL